MVKKLTKEERIVRIKNKEQRRMDKSKKIIKRIMTDSDIDQFITMHQSMIDSLLVIKQERKQ